MGTSIESFIQAASSFKGAGYVKLQGEGNTQQAVQYGGHFFARHCGWFSKPSAEQNAAVRANLLQTLAHSPEKFSDKAINVAAQALGMQGDATLQIAHSPLSKREVLQVINQTRVFDRNEALGLNTVKREEVPDKYLELYDKVMSGGTDAEAARMAEHMNFARFDQQDIYRTLDSLLQSPDGQKFVNLREDLFRACFNSVNGHLSNAEAVLSREEIKNFVEEKVHQKMTDKFEAHQAVLDLADPEKTHPPISDAQKNYLLERSTSDILFTKKAYVQLLDGGRDAAIPFIQAMNKENPSMQEIADAFESFILNEAGVVRNAELGELDGNDLMGISSDLLQMAGIALNKGMDEEGAFPATEEAKKNFAKFFDELNFVNCLGNCGKNLRMPNNRVESFPEANRLRGAFCEGTDYHDLKSFSEVSDVTKNFLKHFDTTICENVPFNTALTGEYGSVVDDFFVSELKGSADKALEDLARAKADPDKFNGGKDIFLKLNTRCYKDVNRGYGLKIGDTVVNELGHGPVSETELLEKMKVCFTKNGVFDEAGFAAVTSFTNQDAAFLVNVGFPTKNIGPLTQILSTAGGMNQFDVTPNDDGSYSVTYTYENKHLAFAGVYGTPDYARLDPEANNTCKAQFSVRLAVVDGKTEISTENRSTYEFHFADKISPEDEIDISNGRMDDATSVDNIQEMYAAFVAEQGLEDLGPLSDEELARTIGIAQEKYKSGRPSQQVTSKNACQVFMEKALREIIREKISSKNTETAVSSADDAVIQAKVASLIEQKPEYAGLRGTLVRLGENSVQTLLQNTTDRLLTAMDFEREMNTAFEKEFEVRENLMTRIEELSSQELPEQDRLSPSKKDWFTRAIHENSQMNSSAMLDAVLENQNYFSKFLEDLADPMADPMTNTVNLFRDFSLQNAALTSILKKHFPDTELSGDQQDFFAQALMEVSELTVEDMVEEDLEYPQETLDTLNRMATELQYVAREIGSKSAEERLQGPVHGNDASFSCIQKRGENLRSFLLQRFPDMEPAAYPQNFEGLSNETRMCLMEAGLYLNDYAGTAHKGEARLGRNFAAGLMSRLNSYNAEVRRRNDPLEKALAEVCYDQGRQGMGLIFNGVPFSEVSDTKTPEETVAKFKELCTPQGQTEPDMEMIRCLGAIVQQSLAADLQMELKENPDSPFMSGIGASGYEATFSIDGNPVDGFVVDFNLTMKAGFIPVVDDNGMGIPPQKLEPESSFSTNIQLHVQRNAEGRIELTMPEDGLLRFDIRPLVEEQ